MIKGSAKVERAVELLDQGMEPRQVAKECGYKDAGAMMAAINRMENKKAVTVLAEEKKPEPAKKAKAPAAKPKKEKGANLTDAQVKADYEKAVQLLKEEEANRADCETKTEHIVLTYNRETESIRVNVKGQRHYLWVDGRNAKKGGAVKMLLELSAACRAMAAIIKGSY